MMDDLAGSAMLLPQVLVLGDWDRAEMASVKAWVRSLGDSAKLWTCSSIGVGEPGGVSPRTLQPRSPGANATRLACLIGESDSTSPDMVIVFQSWPDEISASEVETHLGRWPLALWICCFGSWCESDGRTRAIWPIGIRVPARAAIARLNRLWAIVTGRLQEPLPITASRDEAFEFDSTLIADRAADVIDVKDVVVIVRSPDTALRLWLSDLANSLGASHLDSNTTAFAKSTIVLWDVDPDWAQAMTEIKEFITLHSGKRVIAVAGLPHPELESSLRAIGVEAVITKAYATSQLAGLFSTLMANESHG